MKDIRDIILSANEPQGRRKQEFKKQTLAAKGVQLARKAKTGK
jgi:hypothetical protein